MSDILKIKSGNSWIGIPTITGEKGDTGVGVPSGGTSGQFLKKTSSTDYETAWASPSAIDVGAVSDVQIDSLTAVSSGIANIPVASSSELGVIKVGAEFVIASKQLRLKPADSTDIKTGTSERRPISVMRQHEAVFYGLAKAAGDSTQSASSNTVGVYTETAKSKISDMFNVSETVVGSTPSIVAQSGVTYMCGEVSSLTFAAPSIGICDVMFTSGATAADITLTGVTMPDDWPAALDSNTVYEINVLNGYGVFSSWAVSS